MGRLKIDELPGELRRAIPQTIRRELEEGNRAVESWLAATRLVYWPIQIELKWMLGESSPEVQPAQRISNPFRRLLFDEVLRTT